MKRTLQLSLALSAFVLISAASSGQEKQAVPRDKQGAQHESLPADDPAAVTALARNELVRFRLNAQGNIDKLECEGARGPRAVWLIHRHKLNQEQIDARHIEAMKQLKGLHSLRTLLLIPGTDDDLVYVKDLKSLERLETFGPAARGFGLDNPTTDASLVNLRGLTRLSALVLADAKGITDAGLENLAPLASLELLDLSGTSVRGAGLKHLANLKQLLEVDLCKTPLEDDGIEVVLAFRRLRRLDLGDTQLTDKSLPVLAKLPAQANVDIGGTRITRRGVYSTPGARAIVGAGKFADDLAPEAYGETGGPMSSAGNKASRNDGGDDPESVRKLRAAKCVGIDFDEKGENITEVWCVDSPSVRSEMVHVTGLHHVRALDVQAKLADNDLGFLKSLMTLESLNLSGTRITDAGLANLRTLTRLTDLELPKSKDITDAGLGNLAALTELRTLILDDSGVHGEGLKHLQRMTKLSRLSLRNTPADDDALAIIGSFESLGNLDLAGTKITDEGLSKLKTLSHLSWLDLYDTQITRAGGERLRVKLPKVHISFPLSQRNASELGPTLDELNRRFR